jgi:hypothetical protein
MPENKIDKKFNFSSDGNWNIHVCGSLGYFLQLSFPFNRNEHNDLPTAIITKRLETAHLTAQNPTLWQQYPEKYCQLQCYKNNGMKVPHFAQVCQPCSLLDKYEFYMIYSLNERQIGRWKKIRQQELQIITARSIVLGWWSRGGWD